MDRPLFFGYFSAFLVLSILVLFPMDPVFCGNDTFKVINVKNVVRQNSKIEQSHQDYYINYGAEEGAKVGGILSARRFVEKRSEVELISDKELYIPVGTLKIILVEDDSCVARLVSLAARSGNPLLEYDSVMIGDIVSPVKEEERPAEVMILPDDILFDLNRSNLRREAINTLKDIYGIIVNKGYKRVVIDGHTDSTGSNAYNMLLSKKRAVSVFDYLTKSAGLPADIFEVNGYGEEKPAAGNTTKEDRQKNRRVEISFYH